MSAALVLAGDGYKIEITADAEKLKAELLAASEAIVAVDGDTLEPARQHLKKLAGFRTELEKSRKAVKEPVLELGRKIDGQAAEFGGSVQREEKRIETLIADFAAKAERARRQAEEDARRAAEEARRLEMEAQRLELERQRLELEAERERQRVEAERLEAEARRQKAGGTMTLKERMEAKRKQEAELAAIQEAKDEAEEELQQRGFEIADGITEARSIAADASLAAITPGPAKVKPVLDFEVQDVAALYRHAPHLVTLVPIRSEILKALKLQQDSDLTIGLPGIEVREVFKVNKR
jgi:DNA repair exonuclease SbcCD ATPase subunit